MNEVGRPSWYKKEENGGVTGSVWKGEGWGAIHGWSNEEGGIKNWDGEISTIGGNKLQ